MKKEIKDYLINDYGLELVPPMAPINDFNLNKRDLYCDIAEFISDILKKRDPENRIYGKVYRFFNKIYPVKFPDERSDNRDYFYYRDRQTKRIKIEFEILWEANTRKQKSFKISVLGNPPWNREIDYCSDTYLEKIDGYMSNMNEFKHITRNKNLELLV